MAKSIRDIPKKRGRPKTTGRGEAVLLRMHPPLTTEVEQFIHQAGGNLSRQDAIRQLVELGLRAAAKRKS